MTLWAPGMTLEASEQAVIEDALKFYRGNKTQTATALNIAIRTLDHKLEKYEQERSKREQARIQHASDRQVLLDHQRGSVAKDPHHAAGVRMESVVEVTAQPQMPVSERSQVQEVLPKQASKRSPGRAS